MYFVFLISSWCPNFQEFADICAQITKKYDIPSLYPLIKRQKLGKYN